MRDKWLSGLQKYERIYSWGYSWRNRAVTDTLFIVHFVDFDLGIVMLFEKDGQQINAVVNFERGSSGTCYTILRLCLDYWINQSGSIARVWKTHFIIFSFRTRDLFPEWIFWRQFAIHFPEYHNIMGTKYKH